MQDECRDDFCALYSVLHLRVFDSKQPKLAPFVARVTAGPLQPSVVREEKAEEGAKERRGERELKRVSRKASRKVSRKVSGRVQGRCRGD